MKFLASSGRSTRSKHFDRASILESLSRRVNLFACLLTCHRDTDCFYRIEIRWSTLSAASAIAICTPFTVPLKPLPREP